MVFQDRAPNETNWSSEEREQITIQIDQLLAKGAIVRCKPTNRQVISNIFLRPKRDGSNRLIINLKKLNSFIAHEHFKMEDRKTAKRLMSPDCYMATLVLKDAYYLISLDKSHRKYVRFQFGQEYFEFTCLPFGLSTAPFVFTKIMKPVVTYLRQQGCQSVIYLDDFLLFGDSYNECLINISKTCTLLKELGFLINEKKSQLIPSKRIQYLGFIFDSSRWVVELPSSKKESVMEKVTKLSRLKRCKIRDFAKFLGTIVSCCFAVNYGWGYTKAFERQKFLALNNKGGNYEEYMYIHEKLRTDFTWWKVNILSSYNPIRNASFVLEIFSDASLSGWGAVCEGKKVHGHWTDEEKMSHINYLEILAAFFGLKCFAVNYNNCQILLRIDNTTAIAYINREGGIQYEHLNNITREIWKWCETRNIWIFASYISSKMNYEADRESRRLEPETEYELADNAFEQIVNKFGKPDIDLFASRENAKCKKYISWQRDPGSVEIDAFTVSWKPYYFYAFPPFSLILRILQKIKQERAHGIVVVPEWPAQPWYPVFQSMLVSEPITFRPDINLLISHNRKTHPIWQKISLVAGNLSGEHSK